MFSGAWRVRRGFSRLRAVSHIALEVLAVIAGPLVRVGEYGIGLVQNARIPFIATKIGVQLQLLHQCPVTGLDDGQRCICLDMEDAIVVAPVFHLIVSLGDIRYSRMMPGFMAHTDLSISPILM